MWGAAFSEDDPLSPKLANDYGVVMGTSHHEPMMRAHQEWGRHGSGSWSYASNGEKLREFWTAGVRRGRAYENVVTLGMRGDGDEPMSAAADVALLERVVADQRAILAREVDPDVTRIPQVWALYKEVQEYYEKGMRVPDDVTLLWSDDNWGNLRRLPTPQERSRSGGAGVYYHFDYVGGPRSYKWLNTVPLPKVWEQMHLAWRYGADRVWIVNVGDLKPMEFPLEFFLTLAWDPAAWPHGRLAEYGRLWAAREFGAAHAAEIAELLASSTMLLGRRKPEHLAPETFSLVNYREADRVADEWRSLREQARRLRDALPAAAVDAYRQLVEHPIAAAAVVAELHVTVGRNRLYAVERRASTNALAARARELFAEDAALTREWDEEIAGGKWRHFMDQTHLGYTTWQQPVRNALPAVTELQVPAPPELGVAVAGGAGAWPSDDPGRPPPRVPPIDPFNDQERRVEVFNRGGTPFRFAARPAEPWLVVSPRQGEVVLETTLSIRVDWERAPVGRHQGSVTIEGPAGPTVTVGVPLFRPASLTPDDLEGFVEADGYVAFDASDFTRATEDGEVHWEAIAEDYHRWAGVSSFPVTAASREPEAGSPQLEYGLYLFSAGELTVEIETAPSLAFVPGRGLRCAVSFDDDQPTTVDVHADHSPDDWARSVMEGRSRVRVPLAVTEPGVHVLKLWRVDPGVVFYKIVVDTGGVRPSYLGPPRSRRGRE